MKILSLHILLLSCTEMKKASCSATKDRIHLIKQQRKVFLDLKNQDQLGKKKYKFDIAKENFAWMADNKKEKKMVKTMKKGSRIMITGYNQEGSQTIDHYSLMGFSKAYGAAKKNCS